MANFVSTTVPYSAPSQALSIKALEQRQKDMLAQMAQGGGITPDNTQTPVQGLGHLANQLGDQFNMARVERQAAAQKAELAQLIAGYDPNRPDAMATVGKIGISNPELAATLMQNFHETGLKKQEFAHQDETQGRLFGHQDTAAAARVQAEKDAATALAERQAAEKRAEEAAKAKEAETAFQRTQSAPQSDIARIMADVKGGRVTQEQGDAAIKKLTQGSIGEQKLIRDERNTIIDNRSTLDTLNEALGLLNSQKSVHAGNYGGATQAIGEHVPKFLQGSSLLPDPETTKNTQRYNEIMGSQALQQLTQMKGASSDRDVQINFKIAANPDAPIENRRVAIGKLMDRLNYHIANSEQTLKEMGGEPLKAPAAGAKDNAPAAAASGVVSVPDEAAAMKLDPGTRFKLPDGRTGTAR